MAVRKMTFSLPGEVAALFIHRVPARERSRYLAAALAEKLGERDRQLAMACDIVNSDPDVRAIEEEFERLDDSVPEPWDPPESAAIRHARER